ncbi:MAG: 3'(2'),5'-bisphosphate nucleotidase CysQ [bacterium]|nr:3'(2'),5'-bisphosphate nucleotidase CysQ [bacterium]MCP5040605.1 3'(2'),5'-bisphosphate nucleotidase CysQ [bacterium]
MPASSSDPNYHEELDCALLAARAAGELIARYFREGVEQWEKSENNPVTQADLEADALIRDVLTAGYPNDGILSEESEDNLERLERERVWIVDPIDGTREFTKQIPEFAVSIALAVGGVPALGVVHNPIEGVTVAGHEGRGVTKNGEPTGLSRCASLSEARIAASRSEEKDGRLEPYEPFFRELRPMGSIAWKLALVACGETDFNLSLKPKHEWDVCAGDFLVHEAGGAYVDFRGERVRYNERDAVHHESMIAGSRVLVEEFLERQPRPEPRLG